MIFNNKPFRYTYENPIVGVLTQSHSFSCKQINAKPTVNITAYNDADFIS